jgi:hypothetical protein
MFSYGVYPSFTSPNKVYLSLHRLVIDDYGGGPMIMEAHHSLARIIHEASTAAAQTGMSTALRSVGFLDVLSSTPTESSRRAPCIHARLHRLATNLHE